MKIKLGGLLEKLVGQSLLKVWTIGLELKFLRNFPCYINF